MDEHNLDRHLKAYCDMHTYFYCFLKQGKTKAARRRQDASRKQL